MTKKPRTKKSVAKTEPSADGAHPLATGEVKKPDSDGRSFRWFLGDRPIGWFLKRIIAPIVVIVVGYSIYDYIKRMMDRQAPPVDACEVVIVIRLSAAEGDWKKVSRLVRDWRQAQGEGDSDCTTEIDTYDALGLLYSGRASRGWDLLQTVRDHVKDPGPLKDRIVYATSFFDRAAGRLYKARKRLRELLESTPVDSVADDLRFEVLYDLTGVETLLGARKEADDRLRQIKSYIGTNELRQARVELLRAQVAYRRGELAAAEKLLDMVSFDEEVFPMRQGVKFFYLALCLDGLERSDEALLARQKALNLFEEAGDEWHKLQMATDEINRAIGAGNEKEAMKHVQGLRTHLDELHAAEDSEATSTGDSFDLIELQATQFEAEIALQKLLKQGASDAVSPGTVRDLLKTALASAEVRGLVLFQVRSHVALAKLAWIEQDHREARERFERAIGLSKASGQFHSAVVALLRRSEYRESTKDRHGQEHDVREAFSLSITLGDKTMIKRCQDILDSIR